MKWSLEVIGLLIIITIPLAPAQGSGKADVKDFFKEITNPIVKQIIRTGSSMTLPELIQSKGFPVEIHNVTSDDGYITTLFRIPHGRFPNNDTYPKKVAYLNHGIIVDASCWIMNSVDKALAYRLADLGNVDVWLGNSRGTKNSLGHVNLHHRDYNYWNFTFHEVGVFDIPKIIDYILMVTQQPDMYYFAHSMGNNEICVTLSTFPEYNSKIRTYFALGPSVFVGNSSNPWKKLAPGLVKFAQEVHDTFIPSSSIGLTEQYPFMGVLGEFCTPRFIFRHICYALIESFYGFDPKEVNYDMGPEIVTYSLSSSSTKSLFHLLQLGLSGEFRKYDYGRRNLEIYGQLLPPEYDLTKITAATALYCGTHDNLVPCRDVDKLADHLPNVKEHQKISWPKFNHVDFLFATDINTFLNDRLIEIVKNDLLYDRKN